MRQLVIVTFDRMIKSDTEKRGENVYIRVTLILSPGSDAALPIDNKSRGAF